VYTEIIIKSYHFIYLLKIKLFTTSDRTCLGRTPALFYSR